MPDVKRLRSQQPVVSHPEQMSAHPEEVLHEAVHGHEALHVGGRLEASHLTLAALTGRLWWETSARLFAYWSVA